MNLFASDYDGTLCFVGGVAQGDIEALKRYRDAGNHVAIVTGRSLASLIEATKDLNIPFDYMAGDNGGIVLDSQLNILYRQEINLSEGHRIIEFLKNQDIIDFYVDDGILSGQYKYDMAVFNIKTSKKIPLNEILAKKSIVGIKVKNASNLHAKVLKDKIEDLQLNSAIVYQNNDMLDVVPIGVSKATAIEFICKYQHYDNIYTIGDAENDLPMIIAYDGFTLNSADIVVQNQASKIFNSVKQCIEYLINNEVDTFKS